MKNSPAAGRYFEGRQQPHSDEDKKMNKEKKREVACGLSRVLEVGHFGGYRFVIFPLVFCVYTSRKGKK